MTVKRYWLVVEKRISKGVDVRKCRLIEIRSNLKRNKGFQGRTENLHDAAILGMKVSRLDKEDKQSSSPYSFEGFKVSYT